MNQLYDIICLLLWLAGCNKIRKIGIGIDSNHQITYASQELKPHQTFTTSSGYSVSFVQEPGKSLAALVQQLSGDFISTLRLSVAEQKFSLKRLACYSQTIQKKFIHLLKASNAQLVLYVGKVGLQGGGLSLSKKGSIRPMKKGDAECCFKSSSKNPGTMDGTHRCLQCGYSCQGSDRLVMRSFYDHHCNNKGCKKCLVNNKCKCLSKETKHCKYCCPSI